jgi:RNA polymerase sigma-70 factor (ECF subfamily)
LVKAARSGEPLAIQALYGRFARAVHGCLLSYVPYGDAEDLMQDVFEAVLRRLDELREPAAFPGWLMATTRNVALQHLRRRRQSDLELHEVEGDGIGPDQSAEVRHVLAALAGTPPKYREVLVLRLVEGMTGPEIAAATGLTHGTVRVYLHEGMQLLRSSFSTAESTGGA